MIPSQTVSFQLLAAAGLLLAADTAVELRVLRAVPSEDASPTASGDSAEVTVLVA
jgi:hypothetical protein